MNVRHIAAEPQLVVFDCKPAVATPEHGAELLRATHQYLTFDNDLNIIISVGTLGHGSIFDQIARSSGPAKVR